ncbi:hypothetical protein HK099_002650 [Clydaea vesicula]|uniref:Uncharacterized protein n=1 Tax=Clydaea vesicula TaxID=447962 RepID=A0AAD5Y1K1_9FUNG|nr:hypothetical protein HK099_002650 [Clydaea vesicula]KAJ3394666.1 hypothetical protein HDU92_006654 [Lobulomyces angularis]
MSNAEVNDVTITKPPIHLGDIMNSREISISLPKGFTPLERILLTANGNVQRIISSYYNSPVTVEIISNQLKNSSNTDSVNVYEREVNLHCMNNICCNAVSTIKVSNEDYIDLIENQKVGVGQLFRYCNLLPEFVLLNVGKNEEKKIFFRFYILKSNGIEINIKETFPLNVFEFSSVKGEKGGIFTENLSTVNGLASYDN